MALNSLLREVTSSRPQEASSASSVHGEGTDRLQHVEATATFPALCSEGSDHVGFADRIHRLSSVPKPGFEPSRSSPFREGTAEYFKTRFWNRQAEAPLMEARMASCLGPLVPTQTGPGSIRSIRSTTHGTDHRAYQPQRWSR